MKKDTSFDLIRINEVAQMLGVSIFTLRAWDKSGRLKAIRLATNGTRRYKKEDIDKFINSNTVNK